MLNNQCIVHQSSSVEKSEKQGIDSTKINTSNVMREVARLTYEFNRGNI